MKHIKEIQDIIKEGLDHNAPGDTILSVILNYCESVINYENNKKESK